MTRKAAVSAKFGGEELYNDLHKSYKATRNRHMPQKGWSFQQQAQQNKNEMKRLGGRR